MLLKNKEFQRLSEMHIRMQQVDRSFSSITARTGANLSGTTRPSNSPTNANVRSHPSKLTIPMPESRPDASHNTTTAKGCRETARTFARKLVGKVAKFKEPAQVLAAYMRPNVAAAPSVTVGFRYESFPEGSTRPKPWNAFPLAAYNNRFQSSSKDGPAGVRSDPVKARHELQPRRRTGFKPLDAIPENTKNDCNRMSFNHGNSLPLFSTRERPSQEAQRRSRSKTAIVNGRTERTLRHVAGHSNLKNGGNHDPELAAMVQRVYDNNNTDAVTRRW